MASGPLSPARGAGAARGELIFALCVLAMAGAVVWQTTAIPVSPLYARVGPHVVPMIAGAGLVLFGTLLLVSALRGGWQPEEERESKPDQRALFWVVGGLALNVLTIGTLGFTLASVLLFTCVARAFGSRAPLRDASIGGAFAIVAYLGFAKALNINIGAGLVENAINALLAAGAR
jgi:putative tricarboxylic transport membrane protein